MQLITQVQVVGGWVTKTVAYLEPDAEDTVEGRKAADKERKREK